MAGIWLSDAELDALERAEGVGVKVYLTIRRRMDRETWLSGARTGLSWNALRERAAHEVRRGKGYQEVSPHVSRVRRQAENLERLGLVSPKGNGEVIVFLCAMARDAAVRAKQTRQGADRVYPHPTGSARYVSKCLNKQDIELRSGVDFEAAAMGDDSGNPAYIRGQGFLPSQSSSSAETKVAPCDAPRGARGVNRDRAAPSQAGPLGQAGKPYAGDRDRPGASHDGRGASVLGLSVRPVGSEVMGVGAGPDGASVAVPAGETHVRYAAGDVLPGESSHAGALADALRAVVVGANVRVPLAAPVFATWAAEGVTPEVVRMGVDRAFSARSKAGSTQPVPLGYVVQCVSSVRAELRQARDVAARGPGKRMTPKGANDRLLLLARELGLKTRAGEDWPELRARVAAAAAAAAERAGHAG